MTQGWQDAVAGLQNQINTVNSQIGVLSGDDATVSSQIATLRTAVSSLQSEVLALEPPLPPPTIGDLSGQVASLFPGTSGNDALDRTPFSFVTSGFATISVLSALIDRRVVRTRVSGTVNFDPATFSNGSQIGKTIASVGVCIGDPTQLSSSNVDNFLTLLTGTRRQYTPNTISSQMPISLDILSFWDASTNILYSTLNPPTEPAALELLGIPLVTGGEGLGGPLPAQALATGKQWSATPGFTFFIFGVFDYSGLAPNPDNSFTISQFRVDYL